MTANPDYFRLIGIPREIRPDSKVLEARYLALCEALHPDAHSIAGMAFQQASEEKASQINQAYLTLKDDLERAEHLLALRGGPSAGEHRLMPPEILESQLEWRERLAEAHGLDALEHNLAKAKKEWEKVWGNILSIFEGNPESSQHGQNEGKASGVNPPWKIKARELLNHGRFLRGLTRELLEKINRVCDQED